MEEIAPDEEIDPATKLLFEDLERLKAETNLSKGASKPKEKIVKIWTFAGIAAALGKEEEQTGKQRGEKTYEMRLAEFYMHFPHIKEIET
jgi:hypothetical protein